MGHEPENSEATPFRERHSDDQQAPPSGQAGDAGSDRPYELTQPPRRDHHAESQGAVARSSGQGGQPDSEQAAVTERRRADKQHNHTHLDVAGGVADPAAHLAQQRRYRGPVSR